MTNEPSERTPIEEQIDQVFNEDSEWQDLGIYFFSDVFPDFMEFEGQMKALGAWFLHLQRSLEDFLEAEKAIFVRNTTPPTAEEVEDYPDDFFWDEAAQHDGASDDLAYSTEYGPRFAFGSIGVAAFAALETLMAELTETYASDVAFTRFTGGRGAPTIERYRLYLEREVGWNMDWGGADRQEFELLQTLRNRFAHSLGDGLSADTSARVTQFLETRDDPYNVDLAHETLKTVGAFAEMLQRCLGEQ